MSNVSVYTSSGCLTNFPLEFSVKLTLRKLLVSFLNKISKAMVAYRFLKQTGYLASLCLYNLKSIRSIHFYSQLFCRQLKKSRRLEIEGFGFPNEGLFHYRTSFFG